MPINANEYTQLALERAERPQLAELWRHEEWAWRESNEPYTVPEGDEVADEQRQAAKAAFIRGDGEAPSLNYPKLDRAELGAGMVRFDGMLARMNREPSDSENELLYESIARKLAELSRHRYILDAVEAANPSEKQQAMDYAEMLSAELFGDPDPLVVASIVQMLTKEARSSSSPSAVELIELLPKVEYAPEYEPRLMTPETIRTLKPFIEEFFDPALSIIESLPEGAIEHEDAVRILQQLAHASDMPDAGAALVNGNALGVSGDKIEVQLGKHRTRLTKETLRTVGLHELIHLKGYYESKDKADEVVSIGLPGSLAFEEGKCMAVEQIMKGEASVRGENYYLAIGLKRGVIDGKKHTFREVYDILWRRDLVKSGKTNAEDIEAAQSRAYQATMRSSRGATDCRDISYYEGNSEAADWFNMIASLDVDDQTRRAMVYATLTTRADPTKPQHLRYLVDHDPNWSCFKGIAVE